MYVLKIGSQKLKWEKILYHENETLPRPRFYHTMNYYALNMNVLILYGGRNDIIPPQGFQKQILFFKDIWVFHLYDYRWEKTKSLQINTFPIANHISIIYKEEIFVIGGVNGKGYYPLNMGKIYLD